MKTTIKHIAIFIATFALIFTSLPMEAHAVSTPPKVKTFNAKTYSTTSVRLTWKKPGKASGYAIYVNGKLYKSLSIKNTAYNVPNLQPGTAYKVYIKTYNTYKQKQYYNSKTKKWQTKKPKKAQWKGKKTRKVNARKYSKASVVRTVSTQAPPKPTDITPGNDTPQTIKPGNITGLTQVETTTNTIKIAWNKLSNCTGYEVYINNQKKTEVGINTTSYTFNNLTANTEYPIKVRAYCRNNDGTRTYGNYASTTITTDIPDNPGGNGNGGGGNNPGDNPGTNTGSTFDYHNIPFAQGSAILGDSSTQGSVDIGNGQKINKGVRKHLLPIVNAWMNENLPADATEAEKVNLCIKAVYELKNTPESIAIMGNPNGYYPDDPTGWKGNSECIRYADYFDTCAYAAGLVSASRLCDRDADYDVPWGRNHVNNFVWVDGNGYIVNLSNSKTSNPTLGLMDFDWINLHAVPSTTKFNCRYY